MIDIIEVKSNSIRESIKGFMRMGNLLRLVIDYILYIYMLNIKL